MTERVAAGVWYALPDPIDPHVMTCEACGATVIAARMFAFHYASMILLDYRNSSRGFSLVGPDAEGKMRTWAKTHKCSETERAPRLRATSPLPGGSS